MDVNLVCEPRAVNTAKTVLLGFKALPRPPKLLVLQWLTNHRRFECFIKGGGERHFMPQFEVSTSSKPLILKRLRLFSR